MSLAFVAEAFLLDMVVMIGEHDRLRYRSCEVCLLNGLSSHHFNIGDPVVV